MACREARRDRHAVYSLQFCSNLPSHSQRTNHTTVQGSLISHIQLIISNGPNSHKNYIHISLNENHIDGLVFNYYPAV